MHEWAVDELVRRIVSGEAAPGHALPVEEKLAAEFGGCPYVFGQGQTGCDGSACRAAWRRG
ncbi:GntR family transcriptional regulator [Streptomyces sp. NPDC002701]|uniref:GntR family transcriptional regulator n=1 Tax=Streptomyces sp. NPDC002701 TaxID=3364661 RepID=UPI0036A30A01